MLPFTPVILILGSSILIRHIILLFGVQRLLNDRRLIHAFINQVNQLHLLDITVHMLLQRLITYAPDPICHELLLACPVIAKYRGRLYYWLLSLAQLILEQVEVNVETG